VEQNLKPSRYKRLFTTSFAGEIPMCWWQLPHFVLGQKAENQDLKANIIKQ
jgi:hypothetical protein